MLREYKNGHFSTVREQNAYDMAQLLISATSCLMYQPICMVSKGITLRFFLVEINNKLTQSLKQIMTEYKLYYFPTKGRVESIRYMLAHKEIPFEDIRYAQDQWPKHKQSIAFNVEMYFFYPV